MSLNKEAREWLIANEVNLDLCDFCERIGFAGTQREDKCPRSKSIFTKKPITDYGAVIKDLDIVECPGFIVYKGSQPLPHIRKEHKVDKTNV